MEQHSMSKAGLGRLLDVSRATASNIYSGKQGISNCSAAILAKHFKLSIDAFLPAIESVFSLTGIVLRGPGFQRKQQSLIRNAM